MTAISTLATQISRSVKRLPAPQMREVLNFIEYLECKEDASFIEYVNERTRKAVQEKKRGKHLTTLKELKTKFTDPDVGLVLRPKKAAKKLRTEKFDPLEFEGAGNLNMTVEEIDHECRKMRDEWDRAF